MTYNELRNKINQLTSSRADQKVVFFDPAFTEFREITCFESSAIRINLTIRDKSKHIENNNPVLR